MFKNTDKVFKLAHVAMSAGCSCRPLTFVFSISTPVLHENIASRLKNLFPNLCCGYIWAYDCGWVWSNYCILAKKMSVEVPFVNPRKHPERIFLFFFLMVGMWMWFKRPYQPKRSKPCAKNSKGARWQDLESLTI